MSTTFLVYCTPWKILSTFRRNKRLHLKYNLDPAHGNSVYLRDDESIGHSHTAWQRMNKISIITYYVSIC